MNNLSHILHRNPQIDISHDIMIFVQNNMRFLSRQIRGQMCTRIENKVKVENFRINIKHNIQKIIELGTNKTYYFPGLPTETILDGLMKPNESFLESTYEHLTIQ